MFRRVVAVAFYLVVPFALAGCGESKPAAKPANKPGETAANETGMKPEEYRGEFAKHKGKEVTLTGRVQGFELTGEEEANVILGNDPVHTVACRIGDRPWAKLAPGQTATITGKQPSDVAAPQLTDCSIASAGANAAQQTTAAEIAAAYSAGEKVLAEKYAGKWLCVSGEVAEVQQDLGVVLVFKGDGKTTVTCSFGVEFQKAVAKMTAGQQVKVLAECQDQDREGRVHFNGCLLIGK